MKRIHLRQSVPALLAVALLTIGSVAEAAIDKNFYKKTAEKVWAINLPQFDPNADLTDPMYQNKSAVIIARYVSLTAKHDESANSAKYTVTGIPNSNAINAIEIDRMMVKINDDAAVSALSEFTIDAPDSEVLNGFKLFYTKPAFGARIYKQDGRLIYVDPKEVHTVTKGKKADKDKEYRLAVPGLEPGDILEYFFARETMADEMSLKATTKTILNKYPVRRYTLDCKISPKLAFEYGCFNGVPDFDFMGKTPDGLNHGNIELSDLEPFDPSTPMFSLGRQLPYWRFNILNNTARLEFISSKPRPGGFRKMIFPYLIQDVCAYVNSVKLPEKLEAKALDIARDWIGKHPSATDREKSDATMMATIYSGIINEKECSNLQICITFCRISEKLNLNIPGRLALTTSRHEAPVTTLSSYRDVDFIVACDDLCYFPSFSSCIAPGEIPPYYNNEAMVKLTASPSIKIPHNMTANLKTPDTKPRQNSLINKTIAEIDPDNHDLLKLSTSTTATGAEKLLKSNFITDADVRSEFERYLGVSSKHKIKKNEKEIKEAFDKIADDLWGCDTRTVTSYKINSMGVTPDAPGIEFDLSGTVSGLVSQAGNGLMVRVGQLAGKELQIRETHRTRNISAVTYAAIHKRTAIELMIPEGYAATPQSVESLNRNTVTPEGSFTVTAKITDSGSVSIVVTGQINRSVYSVNEWPSIVKLLDAGHEFSQASVVLKPV